MLVHSLRSQEQAVIVAPPLNTTNQTEDDLLEVNELLLVSPPKRRGRPTGRANGNGKTGLLRGTV